MPENLKEDLGISSLEREGSFSVDTSQEEFVERAETGFEQAEQAPESTQEGGGGREVVGEGHSAATQQVAAPLTAYQEREQKIEEILSSGLDEVFLGLPTKKQAEFKEEGEKAVAQINNLLTKTKVSVEKIISIIKKWLSLIPRVNKFFLEQEAKIKADQIVKLKK